MEDVEKETKEEGKMYQDVRLNRKTNYVPHQLTNIAALVCLLQIRNSSQHFHHRAQKKSERARERKKEKKKIKAIWLIVVDETRLGWSSSTEFNWNKFFHTYSHCIKIVSSSRTQRLKKNRAATELHHRFSFLLISIIFIQLGDSACLLCERFMEKKKIISIPFSMHLTAKRTNILQAQRL